MKSQLLNSLKVTLGPANTTHTDVTPQSVLHAQIVHLKQPTLTFVKERSNLL